MSKTAFDKIAAGLDDAIAYAGGDESRARVAQPVNVRKVRERVRMTQNAFAKAYRLPLGTLRDWEQHRREPDTGSRISLSMIEADPDGVRQGAEVPERQRQRPRGQVAG